MINQNEFLLEIKKDLEIFSKNLEILLENPETSKIIESVSTPTDLQMASINSMVGKETESDNWLIICFRASDNLVNRSYRKWHLNTLEKMSASMLGNPLLVDHEWFEIEASIGFVFDTQLQKTNIKPSYQKSGYEEINQGIIDKEGYVQLLAYAAIPKLESFKNLTDCIENKVLDACSTGGEINSVRVICPNCSAIHGREVGFMERGVKGEFICPHVMPNGYVKYYEDDEDMDYEIADYVEIDGNYENLELSICNIGNLPNARIIR